MFCDEPTSGLDSFMAANLVSYLNKMAVAGRTIICTIHQPASEVFNLFKNLLLMADGRVAYMGDLQGALNYFDKLGLKCPSNYNPADFYVHELAVIPGKEVKCKKKINRICDMFEKGKPRIDDAHRQTTFVNNQVHVSPYKVSCLMQYQALAWRSYLITIREPLLTYVRVGQAFVRNNFNILLLLLLLKYYISFSILFILFSKIVALILGLFFLRQKYDQRGLMNINGALFLFLVNLSVQNAFAVINVSNK